MDLYIENNKVMPYQLLPSHTVGQVKNSIRNWLLQQGIDSYTLRLVFSNGEQLSPVVFETSTYDGMNFQSKANLLKGGYIQVKMVNTVKVVNTIEEIEYERGPVGFVYATRNGEKEIDLPTRVGTIREARQGETPHFTLDFTTVNVDETRPFEAFGRYTEGKISAVEVLQDAPEFASEWIDNIFDDIEKDMVKNGANTVSVLLTRPDGTYNQPGSTDIFRARDPPRDFGLDNVLKDNPNTAAFFSTLDGKHHYNVVRATINPK